MKRYLTLKPRVKVKDRPFHSSIQKDYAKEKRERELEKMQKKLL